MDRQGTRRRGGDRLARHQSGMRAESIEGGQGIGVAAKDDQDASFAGDLGCHGKRFRVFDRFFTSIMTVPRGFTLSIVRRATGGRLRRLTPSRATLCEAKRQRAISAAPGTVLCPELERQP
jgi:hypothetical protein